VITADSWPRKGVRAPTKTRILCTLGPNSLDAEVIRGLDERGIDLFRINLSHTPLDAVAPTIEFIRSNSSSPICLDTEGAQVRCGVVAPGVVLEMGASVRLTAEDITGTAEELSLWPRSVFASLEPGHLMTIDFDGALLEVLRSADDEAEAVVVAAGKVASNRAVTIAPAPVLPPLSIKDHEAVELGARMGIEHVALSFANSADDVGMLRTIAGSNAYVIAKIESRAGVKAMESIIGAADAVLIDRGDLSREIPFEHVPIYQKEIIRRANGANTPAFVATNLLESMITNRRPTIAEANDIINTLFDGAHGLVLAAETAVGQHPLQSVDMVLRVIQAFEKSNLARLIDEVPARFRTARNVPTEKANTGS
jgi:pyruvate kinase